MTQKFAKSTQYILFLSFDLDPFPVDKSFNPFDTMSPSTPTVTATSSPAPTSEKCRFHLEMWDPEVDFDPKLRRATHCQEVTLVEVDPNKNEVTVKDYKGNVIRGQTMAAFSNEN